MRDSAIQQPGIRFAYRTRTCQRLIMNGRMPGTTRNLLPLDDKRAVFCIYCHAVITAIDVNTIKNTMFRNFLKIISLPACMSHLTGSVSNHADRGEERPALWRTPLSAAYFTVSLPTRPKEISVILDDNTEMLRAFPRRPSLRNHFPHTPNMTRSSKAYTLIPSTPSRTRLFPDARPHRPFSTSRCGLHESKNVNDNLSAARPTASA
jgi:hypothetical protein